MNLRRFAPLIMAPVLLAGLTAPLLASAQVEPLLPPSALTQLKIGQDVVRAGSIAGLASIPIQQPEQKAQGFLDRIAIAIARQLVQSMVNSTINWINTGHDGGPAYVTQPGKYLQRIADGVVGDYIVNNTDLGFLCSPFQAQIKLALVQQYAEEYKPQCTLSDIGVNLEDFYEDFNKGGWGAWFSVTQNNQNNPYGSYIELQDDLSKKVANAIGIAKEQSIINSGFLSTTKCEAKNPSQSVLNEINFKLEEGESRATLHDVYGEFDETKPAGACIREGAVRTPGKVIADQLGGMLSVGGEQLVSADNVDDLLNAVMIRLLSSTVFRSDKGLFDDVPYNENQPPTYTTTPGLQASCTASPASVKVGGSATWTADLKNLGGATFRWVGAPSDEIPASGTDGKTTLQVTYTKAGPKNASLSVTYPGSQPQTVFCSTTVIVSDTACYPSVTETTIGKVVKWTADPGTFPATQYEWSGTSLPSSVTGKTSTKSFDVTYQSIGTKTASVTFYGATGAPITTNCGSVTVKEFEPLAVSCFIPDSQVKAGTDVRWRGTITGGSGAFTAIQFAGEEENAPGVSAQSGKIWPVPSSQTLEEVRAAIANMTNVPSWTVGPKEWSYLTSDLSIRKSRITFTGSSSGTNVEVSRAYFTPASTPYTATLRVVDANPRVQPVTASCTGGVTITP